MAECKVVRDQAPIKKVKLTMSEEEAQYLLFWIDSHGRPFADDGPVQGALRKALK